MARSNQAVRAVRIAAMSVAFTLLWAGGDPLVAAAFQSPSRGLILPTAVVVVLFAAVCTFVAWSLRLAAARIPRHTGEGA